MQYIITFLYLAKGHIELMHSKLVDGYINFHEQ